MTALRKLIARATAVGLVVALTVLAANALVAYRNTQELYTDAGWVDHTHEVLHELQAVQADLVDAETGQRGYLLTGDEAFLPQYRAVIDRVEGRVDRLAELTADNPAQEERVGRLREAVRAKVGLLRDNVALPAGADRAGVRGPALTRGREAMDAVRRVVDEIEAEERRLLAVRSAGTAWSYRRTVVAVAVATVLAAGVLVAAYVLVRRDLRARQREEDRARESEQFVRLILESTGEGIYGIDRTGACTFINSAGARLLGYEPDELRGKPMHAAVHHTRPDGTPYPEPECPIYTATRGGSRGARVDTEVFWRKDGKPVPVEYASYPMRDEGATLGAVVTFTDVTARKRAEARLKDREEQFRTLANSIPQLAWMVDANGDITWYNRRWYEYTGTTFDEMKGWGWQKVLDPAELPRVLATFEAALAAGEPWEDTFPIRARTGEYRSFLSRMVPIRGEDGTVERWFGTNTDVEDQRRAERDLAEAKEAAEAANRAKSTFLANMSHELRTPLNAVILYSELLQEEAEDQGLTAFLPDLEKIRSAGRHLLGLINNILDLSKIEAGKMELYLENFSLEDVIKDVSATARPLLQKRENALDLQIDPGIGRVHADQTKCRQILFNLLSNASKFTEKGTVTLAAGRAAEGGRDGVVLRVTDTGIGMTPEQTAKLFQPFTQADASTTRKFGGTGLGLTIVKRFCELMGGRIDVASAPGRGTTFTVWLPAEVTPADAGSAADVVLPAAGGAAGRLTVLVVDDDPASRDLLARVLSREGFTVRTAADGRAGLAAAAASPPDVIVLDVIMPRMDGWAVLSALKADPRLADVPVVMHTMFDDKNLGFALGAADYLTKPVDRDRLVGVLNKFRGRRAEGPVLVVEDEPDTREAVVRAMEHDGWAVVQAVNGKAGLAEMDRAKPAAVLLDLMMPEMDGFEFLDEVRKRPDWHDVPVVVMTAKELTPEDRARLNGHVEKVLQKGTYGRDDMLKEVRRLVAVCARRPAGPPAASETTPEVADAPHPDR